MKIEESKDGTLKVIELDSPKWYWFIVDEDNYALIHTGVQVKPRNGSILLTQPGTCVQIV